MIATTYLKRAQLIGNYRKLSEIIGDRPRFFRWGSRVFLDKSRGHRGWTQPGAVQPVPAAAEATDSLGMEYVASAACGTRPSHGDLRVWLAGGAEGRPIRLPARNIGYDLQCRVPSRVDGSAKQARGGGHRGPPAARPPDGWRWCGRSRRWCGAGRNSGYRPQTRADCSSKLGSFRPLAPTLPRKGGGHSKQCLSVSAAPA